MRHPDLQWLRENLIVRDPEPVTMLVGTMLVSFGLWVGSGWGRTPSLLGGLADELLGLFMAGVGMMLFVAMAWDLHRTYTVALMLSVVAWGYLAWSGLIGSDFHNSLPIIYNLLALWSGWAWIRVAWDDAHLQELPSEEVPVWRDSHPT